MPPNRIKGTVILVSFKDLANFKIFSFLRSGNAKQPSSKIFPIEDFAKYDVFK